MKNPNMLYRCPGPLEFEGVSCETTVVDEGEVEAKLAEGWNRTWHGAAEDKLAANEAEQARIAAELEAAAAKSGKGSKKAADAS